MKRQRRQEREKHAVVLDEIAPKETGRQAVAVRQIEHMLGVVVTMLISPRSLEGLYTWQLMVVYNAQPPDVDDVNHQYGRRQHRLFGRFWGHHHLWGKYTT